MRAPCDPIHLPLLIAEDLDDDYQTVAEAAARADVPNPLLRIQTLAEAEALVADAAHERFGFVLLDVNLPDGPGVELVRRLRQDAAFRTTPIVVFSTSDNPRDLRELYSAGVNAYHVKALRHRENLDMLAAIFDYWLHSVCIDEPAPR